MDHAQQHHTQPNRNDAQHDADNDCATPHRTASLDDWLRQAVLEWAALDQGKGQYWERLCRIKANGAEQFTAPARALLATHLPPLAAAIADRIAEATTRRSRAEGFAMIRAMDPKTLAFHTIRAAFAAMSEAAALRDVAMAIGRSLESEQQLADCRERAPMAYRIMQRRIAQVTTAAQRFQIIRDLQQSDSATKLKPWTNRQHLKAGVYLIDILITTTGLFTEQLEREHSECLRTLALTDAARELIDNDHRTAALFLPVRLPMIIPPVDWTSPTAGGYVTHAGGTRSLIKTRNAQHLAALECATMPSVYAAVNAVQSTARRINGEVLRIAEGCQDRNESLGASMPAREPPAIPERPSGSGKVRDLKQTDLDAHAEWARCAAIAHASVRAHRTQRMSCVDKLNIARRFADEPAIYFPHALDFRGRLYPTPEKLHPQGDDLARGLLQFADGKRLGTRGLYWLKIHAANCFGIEKAPFDVRIAWIDQRRADIVATGANPQHAQAMWRRAPDPWQALAATLELSRAWTSGAPEDWVSYLPIPMDGSCNGLQHFSALLRDPVGGEATNLTPQDRPADIYANVARSVTARVYVSAQAGTQSAAFWDGKITRKLIKQPVMTLSYGATRFGMRLQLADALAELYPADAARPDAWDACGFLAAVTFDCIGESVSAALQTMDWLRATARVVSATGLPMQWTTPMGLPVMQHYQVREARPVEVHIAGRRTELTLAHDTLILDRKKQAQCISPNFIHSLDAAHLMATVNRAHASGLRSFAMVHDSYGVHAADTDTLHALIRSTFEEQYRGNLLETFKAEVCAALAPTEAVKVPPAPTPGTLSLETLGQSLYFFA